MRVRFPPPALVLLMAAAGCAPYPPQFPPPSAAAAGASFHRVRRGETLWSIARRHGVRVGELARANRLTDATRIEVGRKLVIPPGGNPEPAAERTQADQIVRGRVAPATRHFWSDDHRGRRGMPNAGAFGLGSMDGAGEDFAWPVQGRIIAIFGTRLRGRVNKGIDIQSRAGSEVRAARSGKVSFVHEGLPGFGKTIILEHAEGFASVYAYVGEILVRQGDFVAQRQVIARVGETGRAQVPALHFEIRRNQKAQNPLHFLP